MTNTNFQPGDIIAVRGKTWLAKAIRWAMSKYKPGAPRFNHNAVVYRDWSGKDMIAEALFWGVRLWTIDESGYLTHKQCVILRDKRGFKEPHLVQIRSEMKKLKGRRYQYENLPLWLLKIFTGVSLFFKSSEKAIYCSELAAIAINAAYPGTFPKPNVVSPADHFLAPNYEIIDFNHILPENYKR